MIPLHIIEEHNEALALWQAVVPGAFSSQEVVLIHVDHHNDMECGGYEHDFSKPIATWEQAETFVQNACGIADFIIPAIWEGWFSTVVMVKSVVPERFCTEERYVHHRGEGVLHSGKAIPFVHGQYKGDVSSSYRFFQYNEGFGHPLSVNTPCVLDIDLDYFCWDDTLSTAGPKRMEITAEAYRQYRDNPYHPFRLFPRRLLHVISEDGCHYLEYKERQNRRDPDSEERITHRVQCLCTWLSENNITPFYIDICRSRFSGYMPTDRWWFVERTLLAGLAEIYPITVTPPKGGRA